MKHLTLILALLLLFAPRLAYAGGGQMFAFGSTGNIVTIAPEDTAKTSSDANIRKTGLAYNTSNLIIYSKCDVEADRTTYSVASGNLEDVTTLGTYQAPSTNKARFKETTTPGVYEVHLANARFAVTGAKSCFVEIGGTVTGVRNTIKEFPLTDASPQVDCSKISGDSTAADNLELFFDGTGYNAANSTVGTTTNLTNGGGGSSYGNRY